VATSKSDQELEAYGRGRPVGASTIGGNGTGVLPTAGSLISFGDNHMSANGANGNFTSTTALR